MASLPSTVRWAFGTKRSVHFHHCGGGVVSSACNAFGHRCHVLSTTICVAGMLLERPWSQRSHSGARHRSQLAGGILCRRDAGSKCGIARSHCRWQTHTDTAAALAIYLPDVQSCKHPPTGTGPQHSVHHSCSSMCCSPVGGGNSSQDSVRSA